MAADLTKKGPPNRDRNNIHEGHEVAYWTGALNVTKGQLVAAVKAVDVMHGKMLFFHVFDPQLTRRGRAPSTADGKAGEHGDAGFEHTLCRQP